MFFLHLSGSGLFFFIYFPYFRGSAKVWKYFFFLNPSLIRLIMQNIYHGNCMSYPYPDSLSYSRATVTVYRCIVYLDWNRGLFGSLFSPQKPRCGWLRGSETGGGWRVDGARSGGWRRYWGYRGDARPATSQWPASMQHVGSVESVVTTVLFAPYKVQTLNS